MHWLVISLIKATPGNSASSSVVTEQVESMLFLSIVTTGCLDTTTTSGPVGGGSTIAVGGSGTGP